jgi:hypothetical protein
LILPISLGKSFEISLHPTDWGGDTVHFQNLDAALTHSNAVLGVICLLFSAISKNPEYLTRFWSDPINAKIDMEFMEHLAYHVLPAILDDITGFSERPCNLPEDIFQDSFPESNDLRAIKSEGIASPVRTEGRFATPSALIGDAYWLRASDPGQFSMLKLALRSLLPIANRHQVALKNYLEGDITIPICQLTKLGVDIERLFRMNDATCPCAPNTASVQFLAEYLMNWWSEKQKFPAYLVMDLQEAHKAQSALAMLVGEDGARNLGLQVIDYRLLTGNLKVRIFESSLVLLAMRLEESTTALRFAGGSPIHSYGRHVYEEFKVPLYRLGSKSQCSSSSDKSEWQKGEEHKHSHQNLICEWLAKS